MLRGSKPKLLCSERSSPRTASSEEVTNTPQIAGLHALLWRLCGQKDLTTLPGVADHVLRREVKERKAVADTELEQLRIKEWHAYEQCNTEFRKQERYW